jgi:hypothetical protein
MNFGPHGVVTGDTTVHDGKINMNPDSVIPLVEKDILYREFVKIRALLLRRLAVCARDIVLFIGSPQLRVP